MNRLRIEDITKYVEDNIGAFHQKRIDTLDKLKLSQILKQKNPYLFKAKYDLMVSYSNQLNKFTVDFANEFCTETGAIDWDKLVQFNSEAAK